MVNNHPYEKHFELLQPALISKMEEFSLYDYNQVTVNELWNYLIHKVWKHPKDNVRTYELVSDVLSINIMRFMNYSTMEAYKSPDLLADINHEELQELLKPSTKSKK